MWPRTLSTWPRTLESPPSSNPVTVLLPRSSASIRLLDRIEGTRRQLSTRCFDCVTAGSQSLVLYCDRIDAGSLMARRRCDSLRPNPVSLAARLPRVSGVARRPAIIACGAVQGPSSGVAIACSDVELARIEPRRQTRCRDRDCARAADALRRAACVYYGDQILRALIVEPDGTRELASSLNCEESPTRRRKIANALRV
jgi:hypothetical protein